MPPGKTRRTASTLSARAEGPPPTSKSEGRAADARRRSSRAQAGAAAPLRVVVVSEIRLFQDGIAALLEPLHDIRVVGTTSCAQAPGRVAQLEPDVVLFDATRAANLEHAKRLTERAPAPKVVAFGAGEADADIVAFAAAGIAGYTRDDAAPEDVVAVLTSAMRGELLCSPRAAATLSHQVALLSRNAPAAAPGLELSTREIQITGLIDRGLSNKHIARLLGIQATTVKNHVHNILDKLKVHRRGEAAARVRTGLPKPRAPRARARPNASADPSRGDSVISTPPRGASSPSTAPVPEAPASAPSRAGRPGMVVVLEPPPGGSHAGRRRV